MSSNLDPGSGGAPSGGSSDDGSSSDSFDAGSLIDTSGTIPTIRFGALAESIVATALNWVILGVIGAIGLVSGGLQSVLNSLSGFLYSEEQLYPFTPPEPTGLLVRLFRIPESVISGGFDSAGAFFAGFGALGYPLAVGSIVVIGYLSIVAIESAISIVLGGL